MTNEEKRRAAAARDVLAAEEFGVPAPDPSLHHGPITLPDDPTGIAEPHDVLAAEEFALPAPPHGGGDRDGAIRREPQRARAGVVAACALVLLALRRRVRRQHRR
jgi:hypothetical protein